MTAHNTSRSPSPETSPPVALRGEELARAMGTSLELLDEKIELAAKAGQILGEIGMELAALGRWRMERERPLPEMAVHCDLHDDTAVWDGSSVWAEEWSGAADAVGGG